MLKKHERKDPLHCHCYFYDQKTAVCSLLRVSIALSPISVSLTWFSVSTCCNVNSIDFFPFVLGCSAFSPATVRHKSWESKGNVKHVGLSLCKPEPPDRRGLGSQEGLLYCWLHRNNTNSSRLGKILSLRAPRKTWMLWGQVRCQVFLPAGHRK